MCALPRACGVALFVAARIAAADSSAPEISSAARVCRQSALASEWKDDPAEAGTRRLRVRRDLDGDGMADRLDGVEYNGNDSSSDEVTLTLGGGRGKFSGSRGGSFEEMVSYVEVAPELAGDKAEAARRIVEDALIATVCSGPEASAELVLYAPHAPRWQPGEPVMPDTYLFFSTNAEDRAHAGKHARAAWVTYLGANHARDDHARLGAGFRELEPRDGPLELRATAHGVVLIDRAHARHAWLYVTRASSRKLRHPSIKTAHLDGNSAIIETTDGKKTIPLDALLAH